MQDPARQGGRLIPVDQLAVDIRTPIGQVVAPTPQPRRAPTFGETVNAAFENENTLVSTLDRLNNLLGLTEQRDRNYSAWADIQGTEYEDQWLVFADSPNREYTDFLKREIDDERNNRQILAASGVTGWAASTVAGIADPTILIPVGGELKLAGNGAWSITRSALSVGAAGAAGTAVQEGLLQTTQDTRTAEESAIAIGSGAVLSSVLGGGAAALLSRAERQAGETALENIARGAEQTPGSIGAAAVDRSTIADLTPSNAEGFGNAAEAIARGTSWANPNLRSQFRASPRARETAQQLAEQTLYQGMHDRGASLGASVETLARVQSNARLFDSVRTHSAIFSEAKKAGMNLSRQEFEEAIGRAMRRGDAGENEFVTRAAEQWRTRLFDPPKNDAVDLGLLPPDVDVQTATSYFSRLWNREALTAREPEFKDRVAAYYEQQLAGDYADQQAKLAARQQAVDEEIADLRMDPEQRLGVLNELRTRGEQLDAANYEQVDRLSTINDLRNQRRAALAAGDRTRAAEIQRAIDAETTAGGEQLRRYRAERRELRSRYKRVDLNYAGLNERYDSILQSLVDLEVSNENSLNRLVNKGRSLERELQRLDPVKAREKISALRTSFMQIAEKADRAADRSAKAMQRFAEQDAVADDGAKAKLNKAQQDRVAREVAAQRARADRMSKLADRLEAAETFDVDASLLEIRQSVDELVREVSNLSLAKGEKAQRLKERLGRIDTAKLDGRVQALTEAKAQAKANFNSRWGARQDVDGEGFGQSARDIADDVFDKLTGRAQTGSASVLPEYLTPITRGPLKDRTFNIPDELIEDFLDSNVMTVAERYSRTMAGEIELTRRFGRADMRDQIQSIRDDYRALREQVGSATNGKEAVAAMDADTAGRFAKTPEGRNPSREKVLKFLRKDEEGAVRDIEAMRDLIRGTYKAADNAGSWGRIVRAGMAFNYLRSMGGVLFANLSEVYRPAMVHGLRAYLGEGVAPLLSNMKAVKLSVEEAQLAGQVTERVLQNRMLSLGEIGDPYRSGTAVERLLQNASRIASHWNGLVYWTDAMKSISSVLSQNRILKGAGGEGDTRFLAYLGIDKAMGARIAEQFGRHGETLDSVRVANTEKWTDAEAVRAFRAALSKDVDSIIVTRSVGDVPLLANTPHGKMLLQFRGYMFASHQRVFLRGMQESKRRFLSGMVALSALGMMAAYARSWRGGEERHQKFLDAASNPGYLIGEGLDLTGIFAMPFEIANTTEKLTQAAPGLNFSFNPIKSPLLAAGKAVNPDASLQGESTRFAGRSWEGAVGGPTIGLVTDTLRGIGTGATALRGDEVSTSQKRAAAGLLPYSSYLGMREVLQVVTGDSPYVALD